METGGRNRAERRLAAILAADVAGYSRLIGADEEGTLGRLRSIRAKVIDPIIADHRGRLVKTTGDGLLVEFGSVVDALRCATEVQRDMAQRNSETAEPERIEYRIGVHQGDIVVEGDDILGDGVNIAARLEGLAAPGGICVSGRVQEDTAGRLGLSFEDLGEQVLKNIARTVRVYSISAAALPALPPGMNTSKTANPPPAAPPLLSIVVLPLANLSGHAAQDYFADAITDDLTTDLSRIAESFVIARNSAFTYKGKSVDTKQISRDLGVRYIVQGSVRRTGEHVRVNVQLIEAANGAQLWAERFETTRSDLDEAQEEIVSRLAHTLNRELVVAEFGHIERQQKLHPDARDL